MTLLTDRWALAYMVLQKPVLFKFCFLCLWITCDGSCLTYSSLPISEAMHPMPVNSTGTQPHGLSQKVQRLSMAPGQKHRAGCCYALGVAQADSPPTQVYLDSMLIGKSISAHQIHQLFLLKILLLLTLPHRHATIVFVCYFNWNYSFSIENISLL